MLKLLKYLYLLLWKLEREFFSQIRFLQYSSKTPVISIGNLTLGGTGKTPILFEIIEYFRKAGKKIVVLSRGYLSPWEHGFYLVSGNEPQPPEMTDEIILLNKKFPDVPVLVGKNRVHSAKMAEKIFNPDIILLDDGFQYRRFAEKIDLVLWDATVDPDREALIPQGRLREPLTRLSDATAILLTRCESVSDEQRLSIVSKLKKIKTPIQIFEFKTVAESFVDALNNNLPVHQWPKKVYAFAGIANPKSFKKQLASLEIDVIKEKWFRDHYKFSEKEIVQLCEEAQKLKAVPVCTEKDFVKIPKEIALKNGILALKIKMVPVQYEDWIKFLSSLVST